MSLRGVLRALCTACRCHHCACGDQMCGQCRPSSCATLHASVTCPGSRLPTKQVGLNVSPATGIAQVPLPVPCIAILFTSWPRAPLPLSSRSAPAGELQLPAEHCGAADDGGARCHAGGCQVEGAQWFLLAAPCASQPMASPGLDGGCLSVEINPDMYCVGSLLPARRPPTRQHLATC